MAYERSERARNIFGKLIHQFQPKTKTLIRKLERILIKLYRQNVSLLLSQTCVNERLLPNFTHTHTYIYIRVYALYIHAYIQVYAYICTYTYTHILHIQIYIFISTHIHILYTPTLIHIYVPQPWYGYVWNVHRMSIKIEHRNLEIRKTRNDFLVQIRNFLLPLSLKVFRHEEKDTHSFYSDFFICPPSCAAPATKATGQASASKRKPTVFSRGRSQLH